MERSVHGQPSPQQHAPPSSIFFSYPLSQGPVPPARWAHAAAAVGNLMVVYGGVGNAVLDDLAILNTDTMCWRNVTVNARSAKDRPEKMLGHAAAAVGSKLWMFGGQQGRSYLRKLYSFDMEDLMWQHHPSDKLPAARAGHAMVAVRNSIFLFGGQGKKMYNDLHVIDGLTGECREVVAKGKPLTPRRGMSLAHDGGDLLICFGGTHASGMDNKLAAYSLSKGEWFSPATSGQPPSARTNHTAVTLGPGLILFFGGCNTSGSFFQDAYVLDTQTFTWHQPQLLNAAPAPRYHHSCVMANGKVLLYGGINAKQTFDGVVVMETNFHNDISHIAQELEALVSTAPRAVDGTPTSAAAAAHASGSNGNVLDMMKLQLTDLLVKRNMEELHAQATRKAEVVEGLLGQERDAKEALAKELLQLQLMAQEAEANALEWKTRAQEAEARAARDAATAAQLRAAAEQMSAALLERTAELQEVRSTEEGLRKELGILASRYNKLQSYCEGLQQRRRQRSSEAGVSEAGPGPSSRALAERSSAGPTTPTSSTHAAAVASPPNEHLLSLVNDLESSQADLMLQNQQLQVELEQAAQREHELRRKIERLEAKPSILENMTLVQLQQLEQQLDAAARAARDAVVHRTIADSQRRMSSEQQQCSVCLEAPKGVAFVPCGHQSCAACSEKLTACPFCRSSITTRIKLFDA